MEKHYLAYEFDHNTLEDGQTNADFFCYVPISSDIYKLTLLQADLHLGNKAIIDEFQYYVYKKQIFSKLPQLQPLKDYYFKINFINYVSFLHKILKALYLVDVSRIFSIKNYKFKLDNLSYILIHNISKSTLVFIVKKPYAYTATEVENYFNKYYSILLKKNYETTHSIIFEAINVNTNTCRRIFTNKLLEKNLKLSNNSYRLSCYEYNIFENNQLNENFSMSQIELLCQDFDKNKLLLRYNTDSAIHLCSMEYHDNDY